MQKISNLVRDIMGVKPGKDCLVEVYIPYFIDGQKKLLDHAIEVMSDCFGGTTLFHANGGWVDADGKLIRDDLYVLRSYCTETELVKNILRLKHLLFKIKNVLDQETVAFSINGTLFFI